MASFLSLAIELQQIIFDGVPRDDLVNVRLVCKEFRATSSRIFVDWYFIQVAVTLTPPSMRRLHRLASHLFGQSVQSISVSTSIYTAETLRTVVRSSKSSTKIHNHRQQLYVPQPTKNMSGLLINWM
jgi:hypothetical protein